MQGIRPIMITGDHKDTAIAIALELGIIKDETQAITGSMLNEMSDEEFEKNIEKYSVYARVQPEHKVRIVNTWKKKGKISAMTGDGVNDAIAALKIGDYAKAADLTALAARVDTLEKSPAAGITAEKIAAWDAKQNAGNYVDQTAYDTKIS